MMVGVVMGVVVDVSCNGAGWGLQDYPPGNPLQNSGESVPVGSRWVARRLFAVNSTAVGKKNNAVDRPSLDDLRSQGVMQRVPYRFARDATFRQHNTPQRESGCGPKHATVPDVFNSGQHGAADGFFCIQCSN